ncbi:MAG: MCE family protein [Desulfobacteraceae bacterium]|nr:MCE family protein [Desulfobacteraceae bacterium]
MQVFRSEIKVGLLVLVSFLIFVIGIFVVSDIRSLWDKKKTYKIVFSYADGITRGSPVWYAGYEVGSVTDIQIAQGGADGIALTVRIAPEARIRKDSRTEIRSLGMMGAKYVEITPGSVDAEELPPGSTFEGARSTSFAEIMVIGQQVAERLNELVSETKTLVHEVRTEYPVKDVMVNANRFLTILQQQASQLDPVMKNLQHLTGNGGHEIISLVKDLRDTNKDVQKRLQTMEAEITKMLGAAGNGFTEVHGTVKGVRGFLSANEDNLQSLLTHLDQTANNLEILSEDLKTHPWKVIWREDGSADTVPKGSEQWREKGRIGPYGKK